MSVHGSATRGSKSLQHPKVATVTASQALKLSCSMNRYLNFRHFCGPGSCRDQWDGWRLTRFILLLEKKSWARSGNKPIANTNSTEGGKSRVTKVVLRAGESQESLLKRFRKRVTRDRILSTLKKKRHFVPKSEERRIAHRKAIRRERKRQRRAEQRYRR